MKSTSYIFEDLPDAVKAEALAAGIVRKCSHCGADFVASDARVRFCSDECRRLRHIEQVNSYRERRKQYDSGRSHAIERIFGTH